MDVDVTSLYNRRAGQRWDRCAVGDIFERVAEVSPDAEAIVGGPGAFSSPIFERLSYAEADAWANRLAHAFRARGIGRGDRVLMICENSVEALLATVGVAKLGGVLVPVNPSQTADMLAHALQLSEPRLIIADAEHGAFPEAAGLEVDMTIPIGRPVGRQGPHLLEFCDGFPSVSPEATIDGGDIWQILFTSGTTAMPKGVMLSNITTYLTALSFAISYCRGLRHESQLRMACFAPVIFHIGVQAYAFPPLFTGGTLILGRRFRPAVIAATIAAERATAVIGGGVPLAVQLVEEMEALGPEAMRSLTFFMFGLGMLPPPVRARLEALSPSVTLVCLAGQTESVGAHRFAADVFDEKYREVVARGANLIGKPTPIMASRIVDLDDGATPVAPGVTGELVYRSPIMMAGYYRDEEATRKAFAGGWFHTGDLGVADPDGHRFIVGRLKDIIKTGGENVSAPRVEAVLIQHPAVERAAVVGLPDEAWGEVVTGAVVVAKGQTVGEAELIAFCRERLAGYETPKRIVQLDELPLDFIGKVRKFALREMLSAGAVGP
jgi:acyl-CoA synthetase (AMP-forming)/AMP-acid ligase II